MEEEREVEGEIDIVAVRMECLNLAVAAKEAGQGVVSLAEKFFAFVTGGITIVPIEEPQKPDQSTEH